MYNIDETFVKFSDSKGFVLTCEKRGEKQHCFSQLSGTSDKGGVTSEIMVNARDDYVEPMIILKRARLDETNFRNQFHIRDDNDNQLQFTVAKIDNGWITAKTLYEYLVNTFDK